MEDLRLWGAPSLRQKLACFIVYMLIINQIVRKNNVQRNNKENIYNFPIHIFYLLNYTLYMYLL